jgi:hypothetical protein
MREKHKDRTMMGRLIGCLGLVGWFLAMSFSVAAQETGLVPLFNGKDLSGFGTWLQDHDKNKDPEQVFSVQDGMLRISGKVWGGLITDKEYENYHLLVEFKWGEKTWPPREKGARDSGILLHCVGPEGTVKGLWMESIECNIMEGRTGELLLFPGSNTTKLTVEAEERDGLWYYKAGAPPREFIARDAITRINWHGRDPQWQDVKAFRGKGDIEKPVGEWNRLECICEKDTITCILNGKVVNAGTKASPAKGKIFFQSEAAEIFFRKIELKPLRN